MSSNDTLRPCFVQWSYWYIDIYIGIDCRLKHFSHSGCWSQTKPKLILMFVIWLLRIPSWLTNKVNCGQNYYMKKKKTKKLNNNYSTKVRRQTSFIYNLLITIHYCLEIFPLWTLCSHYVQNKNLPMSDFGTLDLKD